IGARPLIQYSKCVLHFAPAPQLVEDIVDEPEDQLAHELPRRALLFAAEVDELAVDAVSDRPPLVLLDERARIHAKRHVVAAKLPQLGDDRLENRGDADRFL